MSSRQVPVHLEIQARYVLVSALAEGRRILDIGCRDGRGLALLAEAGAAEIAATSDAPDGVSAQLAGAGVEGVEVLLETEGPLPFGDAAFDLVICHELVERASPELLAELRRVLDPTGFLAAAVANPPGRMLGELWGRRETSRQSYEQLYELLAPRFGRMTAFGQSPLVGSLFYDLASEEEDPGLAFDRSLMDDDEQPGWYVLVFGREPVSRDELTIVQLPFGELRAAAAAGTADGPGASLAEAELEATRARVASLELELAAARAGDGSPQSAELVESVDQLAIERDQLATERDQLAIERDQLATERDQLAAERDQLAIERDQLAIERDQLAAERDQLAVDLAAAQARGLDASGAGADAAALEARHQEELARLRMDEESARRELEIQLAATASRLADAEARAEALAARIDDQGREHDESLAKMTELEAAAAMAEQRLDELRLLEQQAEAQHQELTQLRRQHEDGLGRDELEVELASLRTEHASLESQLARARHDGSSLESQIRDLLEESGQLRRALEGTQAELAAAANEREELLARLAATTAAVEIDPAEPEPTVEIALDGELAAPAAGASDPVAFGPDGALPHAAAAVGEAALETDLAAAGMSFDEGVTVEAYPDATPGVAPGPADTGLDTLIAGEPSPPPEPSLDALIAEAADGPAAPPVAAPTDDPVFGELDIAAPEPPLAKPRGPVTLDDLEDLLASSIPPAGRRR